MSGCTTSFFFLNSLMLINKMQIKDLRQLPGSDWIVFHTAVMETCAENAIQGNQMMEKTWMLWCHLCGKQSGSSHQWMFGSWCQHWEYDATPCKTDKQVMEVFFLVCVWLNQEWKHFGSFLNMQGKAEKKLTLNQPEGYGVSPWSNKKSCIYTTVIFILFNHG